MTPQEEAEARATWAAKRKVKAYVRLGKMKQKVQMNMIPPANRRWCTRTCQWYDDTKGGK